VHRREPFLIVITQDGFGNRQERGGKITSVGQEVNEIEKGEEKNKFAEGRTKNSKKKKKK